MIRGVKNQNFNHLWATWCIVAKSSPGIIDVFYEIGEKEMSSKKKTGRRLLVAEDYSKEMEMIYTIECVLYDIYGPHEAA